MERRTRARGAGDKQSAASASKLRPALIAAVAVAGLAALAATPPGKQLLALVAQLIGRVAGGLPGGAATLAGAVGALLIVAFLVLRRRREAAPSPVSRALRRAARPAQQGGERPAPAGGRGAFLAALEDRLKAHEEEGRQLAVHRLDLDGFRQVNARFGSEAGDAALAEIGRRLAELAGDPAHLARLGDDEFAVIQPETGGAKHAEIFAARLQKAVEEPVAAGQAQIPLTASVGIAVAPEHGAEAGRLLAAADLALATAQQAGRGAVGCFAAAMDERLARRRAVEGAVGEALKDGPGRLTLGYRPQYDLGSRRLTGFEVALRLEHPGLGAIDEAELVPAAAAVGALSAATERAVREASRTAARWPQHLRLGFNLFAGHLAGRDIARLMGEALKANHLSPGRIDLEVDEAALSAGGERAADELRRLAEAGYRLVLDRYGSGHCGPADLWGGPFRAVKLDAGLVARIGEGEGAETLVAAMVRLARALGLEALADGAERAEQAHVLILNGCRHVAGPLFGPAVAADKAAAMVEKDARQAEAEERAAAAA